MEKHLLLGILVMLILIVIIIAIAVIFGEFFRKKALEAGQKFEMRLIDFDVKEAKFGCYIPGPDYYIVITTNRLAYEKPIDVIPVLNFKNNAIRGDVISLPREGPVEIVFYGSNLFTNRLDNTEIAERKAIASIFFFRDDTCVTSKFGASPISWHIFPFYDLIKDCQKHYLGSYEIEGLYCDIEGALICFPSHNVCKIKMPP